MAEFYFQETFFIEVWPKMCGTEVGDISEQFKDSRQLAETLWQSMISTIDQYIIQNNFTLDLKVTDGQSFRALVDKMYTINQQNATQTEWSAWPVVSLETNVTNCSFGSQVLGRILQKANYKVEYGMPGPMSHAVIFAEARDGKIYYLDQANGVAVEVAGVLDVDGIKAYRIETEDEKIPFRLVPVCSLEESTANTIWNLNSLRQTAIFDKEDGIKDNMAQRLVQEFGLNSDINYSSWAIDHILPKWKNIRNHPTWQKETIESGQIISQAMK